MQTEMAISGNSGATGAQISAKKSRRKPPPGLTVKLLTLDDLDRRTRAAGRALELQETLVNERGGAGSLSVLRLSMTRSVAVLCAMVEDMQARWLLGEPIDPAAIATIMNARRREAEVVGIDPLPKDVTPDLADYLAAKQAAAASESRSDIITTPDSGKPANRTSEAPIGSTGPVTPCNGAST